MSTEVDAEERHKSSSTLRAVEREENKTEMETERESVTEEEDDFTREMIT